MFQWNSAGLKNKHNELLSWLAVYLIPILELSEDALQGNSSLSGNVVYPSAFIPTFPHESAALYVRRDLPSDLTTLGLYPLLI